MELSTYNREVNYLANNMRPDVSMAVHQCAYSFAPKQFGSEVNHKIFINYPR
jgi:hypothetical protein